MTTRRRRAEIIQFYEPLHPRLRLWLFKFLNILTAKWLALMSALTRARSFNEKHKVSVVQGRFKVLSYFESDGGNSKMKIPFVAAAKWDFHKFLSIKFYSPNDENRNLSIRNRRQNKTLSPWDSFDSFWRDFVLRSLNIELVPRSSLLIY